MKRKLAGLSQEASGAMAMWIEKEKHVFIPGGDRRVLRNKAIMDPWV
jgi:hypothetical protein